MNTAPFRRYRLRIEPLTPIHVGSGQTVEPYEYDLLQEKSGECWLVVLDIGAVLTGLPPAQRLQFEQFADQGNYPGLRRWLRQHADPARHGQWRVRVHPAAYREIAANLNNPARLGEIHLFARDAATGRPYLPGSSIKGAIRTAVVDALARESPARQSDFEAIARQGDRDRRAGVQFEAAVLGNAKPGGNPDLYRDPLRQVAVSDAEIDTEACWIHRIQIVRPQGRAGSDPRDIVIYRDLVGPGLVERPFGMTAELRLHQPLTDRGRMGGNTLPQRIDVAAICRWCNAFYQPRLEQELNRFVQDGTLASHLLLAARGVKPNECLVRLGRHSHFECMTVGEPFHRSPRRGFGASRSYAGGQIPLGWLLVTIEASTQ
jgi:CRISPR-associated protein Csm5